MSTIATLRFSVGRRHLAKDPGLSVPKPSAAHSSYGNNRKGGVHVLFRLTGLPVLVWFTSRPGKFNPKGLVLPILGLPEAGRIRQNVAASLTFKPGSEQRQPRL